MSWLVSSIIAYRSSLSDGSHDSKHRHDDNGNGEVDIAVRQPESHREYLKHVERVQDFQKQEFDDAVNPDFDLVVPINEASGKLKKNPAFN